MVSRRKFLQTTAVLSAAVPAASALGDSAEIKRYVELGKTGLKISEIGFGSSSLQKVGLVTHALDRGVNYFDTAESYRFGWSEEAMGKDLKGHRQNVILASKTKAQARASEADLMKALEGSLSRLQTDYLDIYFNHAVNHVERMQNLSLIHI